MMIKKLGGACFGVLVLFLGFLNAMQLSPAGAAAAAATSFVNGVSGSFCRKEGPKFHCRGFTDEQIRREFALIKSTDLLAPCEAYVAIDLKGSKVTNETLAAIICDCPNLQTLDLGFTEITDISSVVGLRDLRELGLAGCEKMVNFRSLAQLRRLEQLDVGATNFGDADLACIAGLEGLLALDVSYCGNLTDISPLVALQHLQKLILGWCDKIDDFSPLKHLSQLRELDCSNCNLSSDQTINDLDFLEELSGLIVLNVSQCKNIVDIRRVMGLLALRTLNLGGTGIERLPDMRALVSLRELMLSHTLVRDLSPLVALRGLEKLELLGCDGICDISPLAVLRTLRTLVFNRSEGIRDLRPLFGLTELVHLDFEDCDQIVDIRPLVQATKLIFLGLGGTNVVDRSFDASIEVLARFTALRQLEIGYSQISAECRQRLQDALPNCKIGY